MPSDVDTTEEIISFTVFFSLLAIETFVFVKLRCKLEKVGMITLLSYLIASFTRILPNFIVIDIQARAIIEFMTQNLLFFVIYYFTFEILKIEATFISKNSK